MQTIVNGAPSAIIKGTELLKANKNLGGKYHSPESRHIDQNKLLNLLDVYIRNKDICTLDEKKLTILT